MAKIGALGGSFHPFHNGHLMLGQYCLDKKLVKEVWFIPTGVSYLKSGKQMLSGEERLRLLELGIEGRPGMKASDIEIKRPGNTYTVDTLKELKRLYPEHDFYFIVGADCLFSIETWYQASEIFKLCSLLVARRDGKSRWEMRVKAKELMEKYGTSIKILEFQEMNISSTMIRDRIHDGKDFEDLVPAKIAEEIMKKDYFR